MKIKMKSVIVVGLLALVSVSAMAGKKSNKENKKSPANAVVKLSERDLRGEGCETACRMAIYGTETEFNFHSGSSGSSVTMALLNACTEVPGLSEISKKCDEEMAKEEGSIKFTLNAGCVTEGLIKKCSVGFITE